MTEQHWKSEMTPAPVESADDVDFTHKNSEEQSITGAIQDVLDNRRRFSNIEGELFHGFDSSDLELARVWIGQNLGLDNYTVNSVLKLYQFIQKSKRDRLPLGPTSFTYCKTMEEIEAQHKRTKEILGDNVEAFTKGEKIHLEKIGDYEIKMHRHDCEFGTGLMCVSMWREEREVFQVSFYPSNPIKIFEIKGSKPADDEKEDRKRKGDSHRFSSKYNLSPSSALVIECMKIAQHVGIDVDVAGRASTWRNYDIARDKTKRAQADSVYWKVRQELGLKYDKQTEAVIETAEALNRINTGPDNQESWEEEYYRSLELIQSSSTRHQSLYEGGADEFVTKLLFSNYTHEYIQNYFDIQMWARQNFQIPQRNTDYLTEKQPNEDWLHFKLPLFMNVDAKQRDKIITDTVQLKE